MPNKVEKRVPSKKKTPKSPQERKKILIKIALIAAAAIAVVGLLIWGIYHIAVDYYLGKINYETKETGLVFETQVIKETGTLDENETITEELPEKGVLPNIKDTDDVTNILLLATDERFKNEASRSDTMILVSINNKTKKIVLCSFMRDILASFPEDISSPVAGKSDKLTHAHAYGGAALTKAVLKETFNIDVQHHVRVNFYDFAKIIDAMGGLEVPLSAAEVDVINDYASRNDDENKGLGTTAADFIVNKGKGVYLLNGIQAVHHARNRAIGSDWGRTQRQRQILELTLTKMSSLSLTQVMNFFEVVLPLVTTNMPKQLLKDMVGDILKYANYERVSTRVPENGSYSEEKYNIIVFPENIYRLYEEIYGSPAENDPRYAAEEKTTAESATKEN